ncbi:MAG TPA: lytic transglycosylase domain-containing protein [Pyrinomonadaceae bacterium]|nr:lytic transglycosylase domain-containing protein [Pyrinomonadaceae bacterium]
MKRRVLLIFILLLLLSAAGLYFFNQYWIHRYDALIERQANIYRLDPDLVWSVIYEETYFRPWKIGADGEIGLMQVTPTVGREWAAQTGMRELERQMAADPQSLLQDPEKNIQIGCWYLEKFYEQYRDVPGTEARMVAGYNAGPTRVSDWSRTSQGGRVLSEAEFINNINIASTKNYVTSILERYRSLKSRRARATSNIDGNQVERAQEARAGTLGP